MIAFFWNIITTCMAHPFYSAAVAVIIYGAYQSGVWQGRIIERDEFEKEQERKPDLRHENKPY